MRRVIIFTAVIFLLGGAGLVMGADYGPYGYPGYGPYQAPQMPPMPQGPYPTYGGQADMEKGVTDKGYTLRVYTAPRRPQDIEVSVDQGALVLRGVRSEQTDYRREGRYSYHRSFSTYYRRVPLPQDADPSRLVRTDGDGFIDILIPKVQ